MNTKIFLLISFWLLPLVMNGQTVTGTVYEIKNNSEISLPGVNVYWAGSEIGIASDENGKFELFKPSKYTDLVFSFVGYKSDTLKVSLKNHVLMHREDVVITPHIAFDSREAIERILDTTVSNICSFFKDKDLCKNIVHCKNTLSKSTARCKNTVT